MGPGAGAGGWFNLKPVLAGLLLIFLSDGVVAEPDLRSRLDEARRVSYQEHWQQAQAMLDELAERIDPSDLREYADFHLLEARHLVLADREEEALQRAAELLEMDLADDQRLRALQFSANVGVLLRQYERAFEYLGRALAIRVELEDPAPQIATFNMASYMFGRVGEYERGIRYGERAVALARDLAGPSEVCVALQRLAPVYKWAGQPERSEQAYRDGIDACQGVGNALFVGVLQHGLADLLRQRGRIEEAMNLAERAIAGLERAIYPLGEYEARLVRAEILHDLGRPDAAEQTDLLRLSEYFGEREVWDQAARLEMLLSRMAEVDGDAARALEHLHRAMQARESFLGRERAMRLAYLQVEFDARFQEQEIELLRESTRVAYLEAQTAVQQQRVRTLGMLLVGLTFLVLLATLLRVFRSRRRFRDLSRQDHLSGLANHGWFFERAQNLLDQFLAERPGGHLILVVADIDHFKKINDRFGHRAGDEVLGRTARRMRESFPEPALIGRIGGEEFAVLIRADSLDTVLGFIERFRRPDPDSIRADDPEVTLSFGLSCHQPGDDIEALRERADRALYAAKAAGRDCYRLDANCSALR